jgi:histidinol dehydrogenase
MSDQSFLEQRLDASTWPIAVGDVVVLLLFLLAGTLQHWAPGQLQTDPVIYAYAAGPFVLGWLVCAPLVGAYSPGGGSAPNSSIPLAIRSWIPAAVVGLVVRVVVVPNRGFDPIFAAIMLVGGALVLAVWRYLYFLVR